MKIIEVKFTPNEFRFDELVLNPNISPEMGSISVKTKETISYSVKPMKHSGILNLKVFWMLTIENDTQTKELLYCETQDIVNLSEIINLDNEEEDLKNLCKETFKRFSDYFDSRKIELGLLQRSLSLEEYQIVQFCSYVKTKLM